MPGALRARPMSLESVPEHFDITVFFSNSNITGAVRI